MFSDDRLVTYRWIRRLASEITVDRGSLADTTPVLRWKIRRRDSSAGTRAASARELAASLWRFAKFDDGGNVTWRFGRRVFEFCSSVPKFAMEEITKWDNCYSKPLEDFSFFCSQNLIANRRKDIATNGQELVHDLKPERGLRKKANKETIRTIAENKEMCSTVKCLMDDLANERRKCKKMENANAELLADIVKTKSSARKLNQILGKEKKARELLENVCSELAKAVEGSKAEIVALRKQSVSIQEEVENERKMLQMAEVLREEQAQMKLVDAKVILEDKYMKMNGLIADFGAILGPSDLGQAVEPTVDKNSVSNGSTVGNVSRNGKSGKWIASGRCDPSCSRSHMSQSSEVTSVSSKPSKKISKHRGSGKLSNGSICSTVSLGSVQRVSVEGTIENGHGQLLQSSEQTNPHVVRAMKGHIVWPRVVQRRGLSANLLEAKLESQKTLIRNVLNNRR